jgi:SAM-dependent methyltransferase
VPSITAEAAGVQRVTAGCVWCGAAATLIAPSLIRCSACGAATTFPAPSDDELERAYKTWYRPAGGRFAGGGDRLLTFSRATLARRLDRIAPPGPVLDVGAGDGTLVRALRRRGREALGVERVAGDGVLAADIETFDDRSGQWAAVVFWHSLEHLRDPAAAVDRAAALLAPGGVLAIAVPNLSSWQARCFGERWFHLDPPRHLVHLPASALQMGLRDRGLAIQRTSHWRGGQILFGWLHGFAGMLPGRPDLYSAIRRVDAQNAPVVGARRVAVLVAGTAIAPVAAAASVAEISARAGGTIYIEARRR